MDRRHSFRPGARRARCPCFCSRRQRRAARGVAAPRSGDAALNAIVRPHLPGAGQALAELRHLARPRQGRQRALRRSSTQAGPPPGPRRGRLARNKPRSSPRCARRSGQPVRGGALNREVVIYDLEPIAVAPSVQHRFRRKALSDQPAGRRLFLDARLPQQPRTDRHRGRRRSLSVAPAQFATVLDNDTPSSARQAARGFLAPGWSLDLRSARCASCAASRGPEHDGRLDRRPRRAKGIAGDWAARATKIVAARSIPALDRQIALMEKLRTTTRPGDGAWRLPAARDLCRRARPGDDHQLHARRSAPARPVAGRRISASSTAILKARASPAAASASGCRRSTSARRSSIPTPTPAAPS
jgi:hypothetical protein